MNCGNSSAQELPEQKEGLNSRCILVIHPLAGYPIGGKSVTLEEYRERIKSYINGGGFAIVVFQRRNLEEDFLVDLTEEQQRKIRFIQRITNHSNRIDLDGQGLAILEHIEKYNTRVDYIEVIGGHEHLCIKSIVDAVSKRFKGVLKINPELVY